MNAIARLIAAAAAGAIVVFAFFTFLKPVHVAPPAEDALVQHVDLTRIVSFTDVDSRTFDVVDDAGKHYRMEFTEACPGLVQAKTFSLVTEDYRDLDRFTGIAVKGRICTFKDFSPRAP
ncbi:MAG: hypothetical protein U1F31_04550 [Steroidobacteraceae bacterium]|jgi:hypothetical protein|nr:hypothetical protein [Steroidobacteraceae bacterium]